jgi:hypothetical protein
VANWDERSLAVAGEFFDRWDKRDDLGRDVKVQDIKRRRKEFTYFMRACAVAYLESRRMASI